MSDENGELAGPGWYEPEGEPGRKRWWDGQAWGHNFDEKDSAAPETTGALVSDSSNDHMPEKLGEVETQFEPNLAAVGVAVLGAIIALVSIFLPELDSTTFARISENTMIQNGDGWLIILFALGVFGGSYRAWSAKKKSWSVAIFGALIIAVAIYDGTGKRTELHSLVNGFESVTVKGSAGIGIYAAGVGGFLALLAGLNLAFGGTILEVSGAKGRETKTCPECAETVLAAATKCRYCGHQFTDATVDAPVRD